MLTQKDKNKKMLNQNKHTKTKYKYKPTRKFKNCSCVCAYHRAQLLYTIQHKKFRLFSLLTSRQSA